MSEQRILKENVLPSEFFAIPEPSPDRGVEAYFPSPGRSPYRKLIPADEFASVVVSDDADALHGVHRRADADQLLVPWTERRREEL